jgi:hypothetical protein
VIKEFLKNRIKKVTTLQGNGFGVIQKALVLQVFSASQTEKTAKMVE